MFKVPQGGDEGNYNRRKDTEGENPKNNIFHCKIHYSR